MAEARKTRNPNSGYSSLSLRVKPLDGVGFVAMADGAWAKGCGGGPDPPVLILIYVPKPPSFAVRDASKSAMSSKPLLPR